MTGWVPVPSVAKEMTGTEGPSPTPSLVSSSPHMAARDLQHFLFREGWELAVSMK